MALIAHVGAWSGGTTVTTASRDTTGATLIVISVECLSSAPGFVSLVDNKGNTYTAGTFQPADGGSAALRLFYCVAPSVGTGHTFTLNSNAGGLCVQAWSGFGTYAGVDNGSNSSTSFVSTIQPGNVTPPGSNYLIVTGVTPLNTGSVSIDSGFTITDTPNGSMAYLVGSSLVNPTWTLGTSTWAAAVIAIFTATPPVNVPLAASFTLGLTATETVSGGPTINEPLAASLGVNLTGTPIVSGGSVTKPLDPSFTVAMTGTPAVSTPVAAPLTASFTLGLTASASPGGATVNPPLEGDFGIGLTGNVIVSAEGLICPLSTTYLKTPYFSLATPVAGTPPYTFSLVPGTVPSNIAAVAIGDSLVKGDYPLGITGWVAQLNTMLGITIQNFAVDGALSSQVVATQLPSALAAYVSGKKNYLFLLAITNDSGTGVPITTTQANYQNIIAQANAKGFYVICLTMTPSNYTAYPNYPAYIAQNTAMNNWLLSGASGAQAVCDSGNDPQLANPADPVFYYSDQLHWLTSACFVVANDMFDTITDPLPPGLALAYQTGAIAGIPQALGRYPYSLLVMDSNGNIAINSCAITVQSGIVIYTLNYRELDTASQISEASPIRTGYTGRLTATDHTRKWTRWNVPAVGAALMYRQPNQLEPSFFIGGNAYTLNSALLTDDDLGQIFPYYTTYFFVTHDEEGALSYMDPKGNRLPLGSGRKLLSYLKWYCAGEGQITVTPFVDNIQNPWVLVGVRTLTSQPKFDMEWPGGQAQGDRIALKFASSPTSGTDNSFQLQRLTAFLKRAQRLQVRGASQ